MVKRMGVCWRTAYTKVLRLEWRVCPQKCEAQCVCGGRKDTEGVNDMHSKAGGG